MWPNRSIGKNWWALETPSVRLQPPQEGRLCVTICNAQKYLQFRRLTSQHAARGKGSHLHKSPCGDHVSFNWHPTSLLFWVGFCFFFPTFKTSFGWACWKTLHYQILTLLLFSGANFSLVRHCPAFSPALCVTACPAMGSRVLRAVSHYQKTLRWQTAFTAYAGKHTSRTSVYVKNNSHRAAGLWRGAAETNGATMWSGAWLCGWQCWVGEVQAM